MSITQRIAKLKSFIAGDSWGEDWPDKQYRPDPLEKMFQKDIFPKHGPLRKIDDTLHGEGCEICDKHAQAVGQLADLFKLHGGSSEAVRGHIDASRTLLNTAHDMHIDDAHGGDNSRKASVESFAPQYSTSSRIASLRNQIRK